MTLAALFASRHAYFLDVLTTIDLYAEDFAKIGENRPPEPRWNQVWFPRLDACAAYAMVRSARPSNIVEIGAGHSTRFLARAIRDGKLPTRHTVIDPQPRATIAGLSIDWKPIPVQQATLPRLGANDILFIDSSHVVAPQSDVAHLVERILPALPAGALIHFHDIFLPAPYPAAWDNRRYNEQDIVATLLTGGQYEILFASAYVTASMADEFSRTKAARLPLVEGAFENSLWLRKIAAA